MKRLYLPSTLSAIALIATTVGASAQAVVFTPPPNNNAPSQATGGASRGMFVPPPNNDAPSQATGGASRGLFTPPPDSDAPSQATGGASRGFFTPPPDSGAPNQTTGGASRGNLFTPDSDNGAPSQASGGASRGNLFTPDSDKGAPSQASGGASRGEPLFTPDPNRAAPEHANGGSSRLGTYYLNPSVVTEGPAALIALLPPSFYGTTIAERPTILVYLPASDAQEAVFSLKDQAGNMQYQAIIPVKGQAGVLAIQLPPTAPALEVGKNYQWFLALKINGELSPSTPYIDGWIQRVEPTAELAAVMQQKDELKQAIALGQNGVWYDCVATLAFLRANQSQNLNLSQQWEELLSSVELKEVASVPLVVLAR